MLRVSGNTKYPKVDSRPRIVLDYDGVILRSNKASSMIANKCDAFVGHVTRNNSIECARSLNQSLFKTYGHSVLGLRSLGYNVSTHEFNGYVYSDIDYASMQLTYADFANFTGLSELIREYQGRVYIYSNAPNEWVTETMNMTYIGRQLFQGVQLLSMHEYEILKPDPNIYVHATNKLGARNVYFVDDMLLNVKNASMSGWCGIWYNPQHESFRVCDDLMSMQNFKDLLYYVALHESQKSIQDICNNTQNVK